MNTLPTYMPVRQPAYRALPTASGVVAQPSSAITQRAAATGQVAANSNAEAAVSIGLETIASPFLALGGAGLGALAARMAGRVAVMGGMWGAIVGDLAVSAYLVAGSLSTHRATPGRVAAVYSGSVAACAGAGFMLGGPMGAIIGAAVSAPVGYLASTLLSKVFPNIWG